VSQNVCAKLGEQLWQPRSGKGKGQRRTDTAALPFADYLKYDGTANASSKFWVSSDSDSNSVDISGRYGKASTASNSRFPGFCTNTAPFSTQSSQDTGSKWQISLDVNGQTLTG
jgi:hypothetical protein